MPIPKFGTRQSPVGIAVAAAFGEVGVIVVGGVGVDVDVEVWRDGGSGLQDVEFPGGDDVGHVGQGGAGGFGGERECEEGGKEEQYVGKEVHD